MFNRFLKAARRAIGAIVEPPVTRESLAATYSQMPDNQLRSLVGTPLTPVAREVLQAELARRGPPVRKASGSSA